jgi:hypothetical protein
MKNYNASHVWKGESVAYDDLEAPPFEVLFLLGYNLSYVQPGEPVLVVDGRLIIPFDLAPQHR